MKKNILIALGFVLSIFVTQAQNCSTYYPMEEGVTFQYTSYNKKGKQETVADYKVTQVNTEGTSTNATMQISLKDKKDKEIYASEYRFSCDNNTVTIDYQSLIPSSMFQQYEGMDMEVSGTDIELPNQLSVGQELTDANVAIKVKMSGINMNMAVDMINRKVEKKEQVTTPAGTYECLVIYSDNRTKTLGINKTYPSRTWIAEGVGMVKQETYNKKGKIIGSTMLSSFGK
ncbi:TapB family protein [Spongiimicrobium salis]|uniref:TapB family protein n=1 Tax=Spongiimicrobium salis TaxID=1667022 RepID=UPI00374D23A6